LLQTGHEQKGVALTRRHFAPIGIGNNWGL
jgi:hypothetical protein